MVARVSGIKSDNEYQCNEGEEAECRELRRRLSRAKKSSSMATSSYGNVEAEVASGQTKSQEQNSSKAGEAN